MKPYIKAIAWRYFYPYRWRILAGLLYMLFIYILGATYVSTEPAPTGEELVGRILYFLFLSPSLVLVVLLISVFSDLYGMDIFLQETSLKKWVLTDPVKTKEIVFWPMLFGMVTVLIYWILLAECIEVLWFEPVNLPKFWPPVFAACILAWSQVFAWRPFGSAIARVIFAAIGYMILFSVPLVCTQYSVPESTIVLILCVLIIVAYITALDSVARARRGDVPDWRWLKAGFEKIENRILRKAPVFQSAEQAMNWYEWRTSGKNLPISSGFIIPIVLMILFLGYLANGFWSPGNLIILIYFPLILSLVLGIASAGFGNSRGDKKVQSFVLAKPITCRQIIKAKYYSFFKSVCLTYFISYIVILIGALFLDRVPFIESLKEHYSYLEIAVIFLLALITPIILAWLLVTFGLAIGLTGRSWVTVAFVAMMFGSLFLLVTSDYWAYQYPIFADLRNKLSIAIPVTILITGPIALGWFLRINFKKKLMQGEEIKKLLGVWAGAFLAIWGLGCWLKPGIGNVWYAFPIVTLILLLIPMLAIAIAPLSLHWNRHR
jgi:hypothetical protein